MIINNFTVYVLPLALTQLYSQCNYEPLVACTVCLKKTAAAIFEGSLRKFCRTTTHELYWAGWQELRPAGMSTEESHAYRFQNARY